MCIEVFLERVCYFGVRTLLVASLLSVAAGCSTLRSEPQWTLLQTPTAQFIVQENTRPVAGWAGRVSWFRPVLEEIVGPMDEVDHTIVYLLIARRDEYLEYFPKTESIGVHRHSNGVSVVLIDASQPAEVVIATLMHEYAHYYFEAREGPDVPLWYEEGIAEYAEAVTVDENGVTMGLVSTAATDALRASALMPLPLLLSTTKADSRYLDPDEAGSFHLSAWALFHYFRHGVPGGRDMLQRYLDAVAAGAAPRQALGRVYGKPAGALDKDLRRYLASGNFTTDFIALDRFRVARPVVWTEPLDEESSYDVRSMLDSMKRYYEEKGAR
jgi:hypothetical protein